MRISMEDVDLAELSSTLRESFPQGAPTGYVVGRTAIRDAAAKALGCSDLEAEEIVDTMVARGFLRYDGDPTAAGQGERPWILRG